MSHDKERRVEMQRTRSAGANSLSIVALFEQTVDTADGELKTRARGARLRLATLAATGCLAARRRLSCLSFARLYHPQKSSLTWLTRVQLLMKAGSD